VRDVPSLPAFVYGPAHAAIMRRRRDWFLPAPDAGSGDVPIVRDDWMCGA